MDISDVILWSYLSGLVYGTAKIATWSDRISRTLSVFRIRMPYPCTCELIAKYMERFLPYAVCRMHVNAALHSRIDHRLNLYQVIATFLIKVAARSPSQCMRRVIGDDCSQTIFLKSEIRRIQNGE